MENKKCRDMCWRDCVLSKKQPCLLHIEKYCPFFISPIMAAEELRRMGEILNGLKLSSTETLVDKLDDSGGYLR